jgi:HSP20 family protein
MRELFEGLGRLMGLGIPGTRRDDGNGLDALMFAPLVEIMHRDGKLIVTVDLPGTAVDDIGVTIDDGALIIEGERRGEREQQDSDVWRRERVYGRFQRVIALPEGAEPSTAEARFENGVLEISLRAPEPAKKSRRIDIKTDRKSSEPANQAGSY